MSELKATITVLDGRTNSTAKAAVSDEGFRMTYLNETRASLVALLTARFINDLAKLTDAELKAMR